MSTRRGVRVWRLERDVTQSSSRDANSRSGAARARSVVTNAFDRVVDVSRARARDGVDARGRWGRSRPREATRVVVAGARKRRGGDGDRARGGGGECVVVGAENHETDERDERVDARLSSWSVFGR